MSWFEINQEGKNIATFPLSRQLSLHSTTGTKAMDLLIHIATHRSKLISACMAAASSMELGRFTLAEVLAPGDLNISYWARIKHMGPDIHKSLGLPVRHLKFRANTDQLPLQHWEIFWWPGQLFSCPDGSLKILNLVGVACYSAAGGCAEKRRGKKEYSKGVSLWPCQCCYHKTCQLWIWSGQLLFWHQGLILWLQSYRIHWALLTGHLKACGCIFGIQVGELFKPANEEQGTK